jgi:hypothetical protein
MFAFKCCSPKRHNDDDDKDDDDDDNDDGDNDDVFAKLKIWPKFHTGFSTILPTDHCEEGLVTFVGWLTERLMV